MSPPRFCCCLFSPNSVGYYRSASVARLYSRRFLAQTATCEADDEFPERALKLLILGRVDERIQTRVDVNRDYCEMIKRRGQAQLFTKVKNEEVHLAAGPAHDEREADERQRLDDVTSRTCHTTLFLNLSVLPTLVCTSSPVVSGSVFIAVVYRLDAAVKD